MPDKTVTYDETALTVIGAMRARVQDLGRHYGYGSPEHVKAASSLMNCLANITVAGFANEAKVFRDDDLSLYVIEGGFHYGIIWFAHKRKCTVDGCGWYLREDGTAYHYGNRDEASAVCAPDAHVPDVPLYQPTPGEWSQHS